MNTPNVTNRMSNALTDEEVELDLKLQTAEAAGLALLEASLAHKEPHTIHEQTAELVSTLRE